MVLQVLFSEKARLKMKNKGDVIVCSMLECPLRLCFWFCIKFRMLNACVFLGQAELSKESDWVW